MTRNGANELRHALAGWPLQNVAAAVATYARYGMPDEFHADALVWHENGPWKRTCVLREVVAHRWPVPHLDVIAQVVDHAIVPDRLGALARFHGGILSDRAKGELTVRCADEAANLLAVNLAHEILDGETDAQQARRIFVRKFPDRHRAGSDSYVSGIRFGRQVETMDPDEPDESRDVVVRPARA